MSEQATPRERGFSMPAEWEPHAGCLMQWPARAELWGDRLGDALAEHAAVARALARFEPVVMVCRPGDSGAVADACGSDVRPLELPINDSWARDSGPIFVRDAAGRVILVSFLFNAWGNRWHPHDDDAALGARLGKVLGMEVVRAPLVLEGGSFLVDGAGTLVTTEQCLLNSNRNPDLGRGEIEEALRDYLGVSVIVWLPNGHSLDVGPEGTDGHVDGVAQYAGPGTVLLEMVADPRSPEHERGLANHEALNRVRDASGRPITVEVLDPGPEAELSYANHYLANGAVIAPVGGRNDDLALARLAEIYPGRQIVPVPGKALAFGGGGPHCITQQIPIGVDLDALSENPVKRWGDPNRSST